MSGKRILVIRCDDLFSSILRDAGHQVIELELIQTSVLDDLSELSAKLTSEKYDGLFFTSPAAAEAFRSIRGELNGFHGKAYVLGKRSREVLDSSGLELRFIEQASTAVEMIDGFGTDEFAGKRFLFVRGERSLKTIPEMLSGIATVDEVVVYSTKAADVDEFSISKVEKMLSRGEISWTCLFSPSGVDEFVKRFGAASRNSNAAAIGTTTADAARKAGLSVGFVSPVADAKTFASALVEHISKGE